MEGDRAQRVKDALSQKDCGLEALEAELTGSPTAPQPDSQIDLLRRLAAVQPPDKDKVTQAVQALRDARPAYNRTTAKKLRKAGMDVLSFTPEKLAGCMAQIMRG